MATKLDTMAEFQDYLRGVIERADDHAHDVNNIVLVIAGAVVLFRDPDTNFIAATYAGKVTNALWVFINGTRYAFSYAHETGEIEMRQNNLRGTTLASFNNTSSIDSIRQVFESL